MWHPVIFLLLLFQHVQSIWRKCGQVVWYAWLIVIENTLTLLGSFSCSFHFITFIVWSLTVSCFLFLLLGSNRGRSCENGLVGSGEKHRWLPYILAYKSLPLISRPPKNRVHMLSKIINPCISRRYSKLMTCCIIVRILGGFYDAQLKCSIARRSLSLRCSSHFRQMWLQLTRPTRPAIGADITWHGDTLVYL